MARFLTDAEGPLRVLYPDNDQQQLCRDLIERAAHIQAERPAELRALDRRREIDPDWFQHQRHVGYVAYASQFGETLTGVGRHLDYLADLGVTYFHLMSVLEPREGANDGGYAVADYRAVDPALGSLDDLVGLARSLRSAGMSLCIDLVMNHTAREHEWAAKARAGDTQYRDYYHVYPDRSIPDRFEQTLPEVFPVIAPGNFTWEPDLAAWVWTTFHDYQWDLNYANPLVLGEMLDIMGFLANHGVEILRLDAVAFTWKRLGTNCQNQPEAHLIVQVLRAFLAMAAPATICKAEAIVGPEELVPYLGAHGRHERRECELAYHNQLMVMGWSSLATRDTRLMATALRRMAEPPSTTSWCTYVRCHDDIGWAVTDTDAAAAGLDGAAHRRFLADYYRGDFPMSFARGVAFSSNSRTGDERTCGSAAALCGIDDARHRGDRVALDLGIRRLLLLYGLAFTWGGLPLIYMGDELGLANDVGYRADPNRAGDSRGAHRPQMDWSQADRRHDPDSVEGRVFSALRHLIDLRTRIPALRAGTAARVIDTDVPAVFAFHRFHPRWGEVVVLANFAESAVEIAIDLLDAAGVGVAFAANLVGADSSAVSGDGRTIRLEPLGMAVLGDSAAAVVPSPP